MSRKGGGRSPAWLKRGPLSPGKLQALPLAATSQRSENVCLWGFLVHNPAVAENQRSRDAAKLHKSDAGQRPLNFRHVNQAAAVAKIAHIAMMASTPHKPVGRRVLC